MKESLSEKLFNNVIEQAESVKNLGVILDAGNSKYNAINAGEYYHLREVCISP